jgi:putative Mg2+ transporter-C (MgtC) family protein
MPLNVTAADLLIRLTSALLAGALLGLERGESGKAAGLRTTIIVCLAATIAMLQVNYLLPMAGKESDSFVTNDLMRLPLGILTGMGFIGAGAILRRGNVVSGITTAATLWYVTVIGLCFGGGQVLLGWVATALGAAVLWGLKSVERLLAAESRAVLTVIVDENGPEEADIRNRISKDTRRVSNSSLLIESRRRRYVFDVTQEPRPTDASIPPQIKALASEDGVRQIIWRRHQ